MTDHSEARRIAPLRLFAALVVVTVAADQLTKWWALSALDPAAEARPLLGNLIRLNLTFNPGAALSFGSSATGILTVISAAVVVAVIVFARRLKSRAWAATLGLLLGGAMGNLIDRLLRAPGVGRGHVVDFIDYHVFIGNVADIAIVGAAAMAMLLTLRGIGLDGMKDTERDATSVPDESETHGPLPPADSSGVRP